MQVTFTPVLLGHNPLIWYLARRFSSLTLSLSSVTCERACFYPLYLSVLPVCLGDSLYTAVALFLGGQGESRKLLPEVNSLV